MNLTAVPHALLVLAGALAGAATAWLLLRRRRPRRPAPTVPVHDDDTLQSIQLAAVGRIAGGLAHDFNNLLTVINGHAQLADEHPDLPADLQHSLQAIRRAGSRGADLIRELQAYDRADILAPRVLDPGHALERVLPELRRIVGEDVDLELRQHDRDVRIVGDEIQFQQLILNLVLNARDAVASRHAPTSRGRITVTLIRVEVGRKNPRGLAPGAHLVVSVTDNGVGMEPAVRDRASEAFFSTKPQATAAGLGLTLVQTIARRAGGAIEITSAPGQGTDVRVLWPLAGATEGEDGADPGPPAREGDGVIVMLTDPGLRGLLTVNLAHLGYQVTSAANEEQLHLRLDEWPPDRRTALIVSGAMTDGAGMLRRIREVRAGLRILLLSERGDQEVPDGAEGAGPIRRLVKPFTTYQLATTLRSMLGAAADEPARSRR